MIASRHLLPMTLVFLALFFAIWKTHAHIRNLQDLLYDGQGTSMFVESLTHVQGPSTTIEGASVEDRKKLRWLLPWAKSQVYQIAQKVSGGSTSLIVYLDHAVHALALTLGFWFIVLSIEKRIGLERRQIPTVWLWCVVGYFYALIVGGWEEAFSTFEMLAIAGVIYAAHTRQTWLFLLFAILAVANRETGVLVGLIYVLFNWRGVKSLWAVGFPPLVFVILNFNLLTEPGLYSSNMISTSGTTRPSILDFWHYSPGEWGPFWLYTLLFYAPLLKHGVSPLLQRDIRPYLYGLIAYVIVLLFGTYLGNLYPHIIALPFLVPMILYGDKRENATMTP